MADTGAPPRSADAKAPGGAEQDDRTPGSRVLAEAGKRRAFATWGTVLYWWAAMLYLAQVRSLIRDTAGA